VCGFGGSVDEGVRADPPFSKARNRPFLFTEVGVRSGEFRGVRSDDSGLDSPEVHDPVGGSLVLAGWVDKGDEFFMHPSGELCSRLVRGLSPHRDSGHLCVRGPSPQGGSTCVGQVRLVCTSTPHLRSYSLHPFFYGRKLTLAPLSPA